MITKQIMSSANASVLLLMSMVIVMTAFYIPAIVRFYQENGDPNAWMHVEKLVVPDFVVGEDPEVCVVSEIKTNFAAQWRTVLRRHETDHRQVWDSFILPAPFDYEPRPMRAFCRPWTVYTGLDLIKDPGVYSLIVTWPMVHNGYERIQRVETQFTVHGF